MTKLFKTAQKVLEVDLSRVQNMHTSMHSLVIFYHILV